MSRMGLGANATDPDAVQVHGTNPQVGSKQVHALRLAGGVALCERDAFVRV